MFVHSKQHKAMVKTQVVRSLLLGVLAMPLMVGIASADVASTYAKTCATCHDSGALNAPKRGDSAKWAALKSQKGVDGLVKSTREGMPQMPAMGLCQSCSNQDFKDLIDYMSK
ncbi:MAG: c-type cytochrome [Moraxella sp.]|nr:c-type cytochrome [Moraxella sp.]